MLADLDQLLAKDLLPDITAVPLSDLRDLRVTCSAAEGDVSFVRRLAQGRLDIVGHETRRRAGVADGDPDVSTLLFDIPDILIDGNGGSAGPSGTPGARPVAVHEPGVLAQSLIAELERTVTAAQLSSLGDLDDDRLAGLVEDLGRFEVDLSTTRRRLHERIDAIQGEIARRYRDGEASIDSLLN
ncbi:MAG: hypothetical protein AAF962_19070 [Actinomycetota bacterium]